MSDSKFPHVKRTIENFINDEDGNITRNKLLMVGSMVVLLGTLYSFNVFADHNSHSSHSSTSYVRNHSNSHGSHSNAYTTSHGSHSSHSNALPGHSSSSANTTHATHSSHASHSNTASHSNSNYSTAGDSLTPTAPKASAIEGVKTPIPNDFATTIPNTLTATATVPDTPQIKK